MTMTKHILRKKVTISVENKAIANVYKAIVKSDTNSIAKIANTLEVYDFVNTTQAYASTVFVTALRKASLLTQVELEKLTCKDEDTTKKLYDLVSKYNVRMYRKDNHKCMNHRQVTERIVRHLNSDTLQKIQKRTV